MSDAIRPVAQDHFTARELAEIARSRGLTSFPVTENGVQRLARCAGWNDLPSPMVRWREGEGRPSREYRWSILPDMMQAAIDARSTQADQTTTLTVREETARRQVAALTTQGLRARGRKVMEARAAILVAIEGHAIAEGRTRGWAIARFLAAQEAYHVRQDIEARRDRGDILTPDEMASLGRPLALTAATGFHLDPMLLVDANDRKTRSPRVSERTLWRWFKARDTRGVAVLAPVPPKEPQPIPPAFGDFLKFYAIPSKPSIADAHRAYMNAVEAATDVQRVPVTLSQARHILRERLNSIERHVGREGILTLRSRMAYIQRTTEDLWPTTIYTADGKTFDAEVADPVSRRPMRPEITSILDVATRKCVGFAISRKENVIAVKEALRRACAGHGIPAMFYVDRGTGYKNKTFDGAETFDLAVAGLLGRLGITKMHALPYNSQAKGIIERFNAHWNDLSKTLPSYIGRDMDKEAGSKAHKASRSDIREFGASRLLPSWDEFLGMCEQKIAEYNDREHSGLPRFEDPVTGRLRHMSPNEAWAAHVASGFEPVEIHPEEEDDLFRPYEIRTVRRALVEWNTNKYFHQDLERYHEEKVMVGYDYSQADRVWVREFDEASGLPGKLICVATFGGNKHRYVPLTAEQAAIEGRVKGQMRRIGRKVEAVQDQLRAPLLDAPVTIRMPDLQASPEPIPVRKEEVEARPKGAAIMSDAELAQLCLADPGQLTAGRARILREAASRRNGRELLRISGVDLDELDALLRSAA